MAPITAITAALLVGGAAAFVAPSPVLKSSVAATSRSASAPMRMSAGEEEPWFSEAVAVNLADVGELT